MLTRYPTIVKEVRGLKIYRISSKKRPLRLFNFETLRCDAYWRAALQRGRRLFQRKRNYSHQLSKLCNFLFENNKKITTITLYSVIYPELLVVFIFSSFVHLFYRHLKLSVVRLRSYF